MESDDHFTRDLAALLSADLAASGAHTVGELEAALVASVGSLLSSPSVEVLPPSEEDKAMRLMSVRLAATKLPGL